MGQLCTFDILPSNLYWKTSDASRQCKIRAAFVDWRSEREPSWNQELLANANGKENFLNNIITHETWVYGCDVETNMQSSRWMGQGSPRPKKGTMIRSKTKVFFFKLERHCPPWVCTTWSDGKQKLYQEVLARLRDAVGRKRPELWENRTWKLHHDNEPVCASLLIRRYLAKYQTSVVPHPPHSPDLAPANFKK